MGTLAICPLTRTKKAARARSLEVVRPAEAPTLRQDRDESPFLSANAADALVLAFATLSKGAAEHRIVAYVLEDGTVVNEGSAVPKGREFTNGRVAGEGWTLWWERRVLGASS